jgi:hypothetical protein
MFFRCDVMHSAWRQQLETSDFLCLVIQTTDGQMEPRQIHTHSDSSASIFLTGAILFANMDYSGLAEYALKAAIGGAIWMTFKIASDFVSEKIKNRKKQ